MESQPAYELNFDGLVGPTHNYAGLSYGNVASTRHRQQLSRPKEAALQGLKKMRWVASLGIPQAILPPQLRPDLQMLRRLGVTGSDAQVLERAFKADPALLAACYSASCMWTANAATISPSPDCQDQRLHLTPANLSNGFHRSIEANQTYRVLSAIFENSDHFQVHPPLPSCSHLSDEGAANHTRLCAEYGGPGIEMFVYGRNAFDATAPAPTRFPARQTKQACEALARCHQLDPNHTFHLQQNPEAIDAGVFHNDVISVGNRNVLLLHEQAFVDPQATLDRLCQRFNEVTGHPLIPVCISTERLSVKDAVTSYLFNSQLVSRPDNQMTLICPQECQKVSSGYQITQWILENDNPIDQVEFLDLRQSMNNGGGPACLRLRIVMNPSQMDAMHQGVLLTDQRYHDLVEWVQRHYRDELSPDDLRDPQLVIECRDAMSDLAYVLGWEPSLFVN